MASAARQRTVASASTRFRGVGLHCGRPISLRLLPAAAGAGIVFARVDLGPGATVKAAAANVTDTMLATTIVENDVAVGTIEHLLSALCACGVDNVVVELDGPEVPIMDGSAMPFITLLHDCGLAELDAAKQFIRILDEVSVELDGGARSAAFVPDAGSVWELRIDFSEQVVRSTPQYRRFEFTSNADYVDTVARARTFGFVRDIEMMRRHQRALGGSLDNAIVLEDDSLLNQDALRMPDEFVSHKLLDAMGDCYIEGLLVLGRYVGRLPGHGLNNQLMRALLDRRDAWELVAADDACAIPRYGALAGAAL